MQHLDDQTPLIKLTMPKKIAALRALMKKHGLDAYLVPSTDPHQDEYIPSFWQRRKYISGFRGSAGDVVVTHTKACLWTDSRYFLQAEQELDSRVFTLFRQGLPGVPDLKDWLGDELIQGAVLGVDPQLLSHRNFTALRKFLNARGIRVKCVVKNLVDAVWENRPDPLPKKIRLHPLKYSGESAKKKVAAVRERMSAHSADLLIVAALDEIAWLFNIRGGDINFNPVVIAYALITPDKTLLFMDPDKITARVRTTLENLVEVRPYESFFPTLREIALKSRRIWVDEDRVNQRIMNSLKRHAGLHLSPGPISRFKAVKNKREIEGFRSSHVRDGRAMVNFLFWLSQAYKKGKITELTAAAQLEEFRAQERLYHGPSFETISAFGPHSAIVHYGATHGTDVPLHGKDIYLVDSGAQYSDATTDITRTVCLGKPRTEHKECFTRVLQGLISLSMLPFPQGTAGRQLDTVARLALWKNGQNYGHGTGHGIGTHLSVHEGPHALSPQRCVGIALEPGMITTIEPGVYLENQFGIRLENVVLVRKDEKLSSDERIFFRFDTLTLCPFDRGLVKKEMLKNEEIGWLDAYHRKVRRILSPLLGKKEKEWLLKATMPI